MNVLTKRLLKILIVMWVFIGIDFLAEWMIQKYFEINTLQFTQERNAQERESLNAAVGSSLIDSARP